MIFVGSPSSRLFDVRPLPPERACDIQRFGLEAQPQAPGYTSMTSVLVARFVEGGFFLPLGQGDPQASDERARVTFRQIPGIDGLQQFFRITLAPTASNQEREVLVLCALSAVER